MGIIRSKIPSGNIIVKKSFAGTEINSKVILGEFTKNVYEKDFSFKYLFLPTRITKEIL